MKKILDIVLKALRDIVNQDISEAQADETMDQLGLDSLDYVELCIYMEEELDAELGNLESKIKGDMTVRQVANLIGKELKK